MVCWNCLQKVVLEIWLTIRPHQFPGVKKNWNVRVYPVRDEYWLLKQCWLLGNSYSFAELSAIVSPRTLENCPYICPRAFWQHPPALSAESRLIMRLVNLGLSTTCLHHKCNPHAQTWPEPCGILAAFPPFTMLFYVSKPSPQTTWSVKEMELVSRSQDYLNYMKIC